MKEENYDKWLDAKSEVEHFDELDYDIKETIYNIEQDLEDEWEAELEKVDLKRKALTFWVSYKKELKVLQEEFDCDEEEAEKIVDVIFDRFHDHLNDYLGEKGWRISAITFTRIEETGAYDEWLMAKCEVEHFNELDDEVKYAIYNVENSFECVLEKIQCEEKEIIFLSNYEDEEEYEDELTREIDEVPKNLTVYNDKGRNKIETGEYKMLVKGGIWKRLFGMNVSVKNSSNFEK